jgi:hypothetical protein
MNASPYSLGARPGLLCVARPSRTWWMAPCDGLVVATGDRDQSAGATVKTCRRLLAHIGVVE